MAFLRGLFQRPARPADDWEDRSGRPWAELSAHDLARYNTEVARARDAQVLARGQWRASRRPEPERALPGVKTTFAAWQRRAPIDQRDCADCAVCLEPLAAEAEVRGFPCGHCFHAACAERWAARSPTCPLCRAAVPRRAELGFEGSVDFDASKDASDAQLRQSDDRLRRLRALCDDALCHAMWTVTADARAASAAVGAWRRVGGAAAAPKVPARIEPTAP